MSEQKLDYERVSEDQIGMWKGWVKFCCGGATLLALILLGLLTIYFN